MTAHMGPVRNVRNRNPKIFPAKIYTFVMFRYLIVGEEDTLYIGFPLTLPKMRYGCFMIND